MPGVSGPGYSIERENLDTEGITFTMCSLWEVSIQRETIAKLNGSF
jgi:hypothetical protein